MSVAVAREQRATAGNRMSKLLDAEEDDDFYKTTYGGFNDESGDDEYHGEHSDTEDEVDSDFDIDEGDEPDSDQEDDAPRKKSRKPAEEQKKAEKTKVEVKRKIPVEFQDFAETRKSVRQSTSEHTRKTNLRLQERQDAPRRRRGAHRVRPLTQDELLAEAEITAEANIRSLENYERLEADKKKHVHKKRRFEGPTVRYHSLLMPLVSHSVLKEETVDPAVAVGGPGLGRGGLCSRTYITFSDEDALEAAAGFLAARAHATPPPAPAVQEVCPVTHKAALYRDPVTDIPYANARAFRIIREAYRKYVAAHGFPSAAGGTMGLETSSSSSAANTKAAVRQKMAVKQAAVAT
ncbi:hypothetical protein CRUP_025225 [Coryphaenoides rupestris]|nr:hypothetical protein CRUP_025225 [Coryphaenoides rupestris]